MYWSDHEWRKVYFWLALVVLVLSVVYVNKSRTDLDLTIQRDLNTITQVSTPELFSLEPSRITSKEWMWFGLSSRQAVVAQRFAKNMDGTDYRQLLQCYVIDSLVLARMMPYLKLPIKPTKERRKKKTYTALYTSKPILKPRKKKKNTPYGVKTNLNKIHFYQLITIFDTVKARRFLKYRDLLGGFADIDQVLEIHGVSMEELKHLKQVTKYQKLEVKALAINVSSFKKLLQHPYLDYNMVKSIVEYRKTMKLLDSHTELQAVLQLNDKQYGKIKPYIIFKIN